VVLDAISRFPLAINTITAAGTGRSGNSTTKSVTEQAPSSRGRKFAKSTSAKRSLVAG